jgi:hypothetical protein
MRFYFTLRKAFKLISSRLKAPLPGTSSDHAFHSLEVFTAPRAPGEQVESPCALPSRLREGAFHDILF